MSTTTGRATTPSVHDVALGSGSGRMTRAVASRPTAAIVISTAPVGTTQNVRVDR